MLVALFVRGSSSWNGITDARRLRFFSLALIRLWTFRAPPADLSGAGKIPASAVEVRYGVPDGRPKKRGQPGFFDSLEDEPEAEIKHARFAMVSKTSANLS